MTKKLFNSRIIRNEYIANNMFEIELHAPKVYNIIKPGQFAHICVERYPAQMLRMPFCVYDINKHNQSIIIDYYLIGDGTKQLSEQRVGDEISIIAPLGNGWSVPKEAKRALLVGGSSGSAALNMLVKHLHAKDIVTDLVLGWSNMERDFCEKRVKPMGESLTGNLYITTEDGTYGYKGLCTDISDLLFDKHEYDYVAVCGSKAMEYNVLKKPIELGIRSQVSMESMMACGVGVCLTCIIDTTKGRKRCCVDGPVFNAEEVIW